MQLKDAVIYATQLWLLLSLLVIQRSCGDFNNGNNNNVKITEHGFELTQTINLQRQEFLQKQCDSLGEQQAQQTMDNIDSLTDEQMEHMIVDRKHKFLYCYVPKVACTNWKRVLLMLTGQRPNVTDPLQIPGLEAHTRGIFENFSNLTSEERKEVMTEYTRFILVRHPFERILSAYRNKLESQGSVARYFQRRIGRQIVRSVRHNPSNQSLELGNDVTFAEFVYYLLTPQISQSNHSAYNEHWEPISRLCNPCAMKYNVIGKYETLLDDSALALYLVGAKNLTFPTSYKSSNTRAHLQHYFDPLPIGTIRRLYEIYKQDFKLFDYGVDDVLGFEFG